jgi:hypothetical protein
MGQHFDVTRRKGGTYFFSQYFDQYPAIETRQIIKAINEELLVDELQIFRNQLLT